MPVYTVQCSTCDSTREVHRNLMDFGKWPQCCGATMQQVIQAPQIMRDIDPYQAVATDVATGSAPVIRSRREHREFLKRNGYHEVGGEHHVQKRHPIDTVTGREIKRVADDVIARKSRR